MAELKDEEIAAAQAEIARLNAEFQDLQMLYEATIQHGEAVEDQLAEANTLLQTTQNRLNGELREAYNYILSIIPLPRAEAPLTDWHFTPSTELGGDSFGFHDIDDDHMAFYLLDVCGHGVGAALLSVTAINVLRSSALMHTDFRDPAAVLAALNAAFPMEKQNDMYFTIWYGVYQRSTSTLSYSSGGHPPSLLLRGNEAQQLMTRGLPMGSFPGMQYKSESITVKAGDRLLILSDGTFEIEKTPGEMLSFDEFIAYVLAPGGDSPGGIFDWIKSFSRETALPDDFSLLRVTF